MPKLSQWFYKTAVIYVIIGMIGGMVMGSKEDFTLAPAHAHLNLIGWVSLFLMGLYYQANPLKAGRRLATIQFWLSTVGLWIFIPGLVMTLTQVGIGVPLTIFGSVVVLAGMILFAVIVHTE